MVLKKKWICKEIISVLHYQKLVSTTTERLWASTKKNETFKTSGATWGNEFELNERSYSISEFQKYFECIIKNHETLTDEPLVQIYVNRIQNRDTFKNKLGAWVLELLIPEVMKLLGSTE